MKGASEETKMVLAAVDAGLKKLHTLDDSITLYEVINVSLNDKISFLILHRYQTAITFQNSGVSAYWMDQEARDEKVVFLLL